MKNKFFYLCAAAALTLGFSACSSEDAPEAVVAAGDANVTFTAQLPNELGSRAFGDGKTATKLSYYVYETGVNPKKAIIATGEAGVEEETFDKTTLTANVTLRLVNGKTYDIVFWAHADGATYYTYDKGAQTITVDYDDVNSNAEDRDAFFNVRKSLAVNGAINETIELRRPFAQVNFGTDDLEETAVKDAYAAGVQTVLKTKAYNKINLFDGSVDENDLVDVTYKIAALPDATKEEFPYEPATYKYLSMNYLLAAADQEIVDMDFEMYNGTTLINTLDVNFVPVRRNYQTNIFGSLLTSSADFKVIIKPAFIDPDYNHEYGEAVSTAADLKAVIEKGGACVLSGDITIPEALNVPAGKTVELNLNGHKITNNGAGYAIEVNGTCTIKGNGTVYGGTGADNQAVHVKSGAVCNIEGGSFNVGPDANGLGNSCIEATGNAVVNISGGTFSSEAAYRGKYYVLNITNGSAAKFNVTGGKFVNYDPATGDDHDGGNWVAEGYKSQKIEGSNPETWEVVKAE